MRAPGVGKSALPFLIGLAGLFLFLVLSSLSFRNRERANPTAPALRPSHAGQSLVESKPEKSPLLSPPVLSPAESPLKLSSPEGLRSRLARFKRWREGLNEFEDPDFRTHFRLTQEELRGVRELILGDPRAFLEWLADPANSAEADILIGITLTDKSGPYQWRYAFQAFDQFPSSLMEGTIHLLRTGSVEVKIALLGFAQTLKDAPPSWRTQFLAMLQDTNTEVADQAAKSLLTNQQATLSEVRAIIDLADRSQRSACLSLAKAVSRDPKWREWLMSSLETGAIGDTQGFKTLSVLEIGLSPESAPPIADRALGSRALQATLSRLTDAKGYYELVRIALGLQLNANQVREALALAATSAPTEALRRAAMDSLSNSDLDSENLALRRSVWMKAYEKYHPVPRDWE